MIKWFKGKPFLFNPSVGILSSIYFFLLPRKLSAELLDIAIAFSKQQFTAVPAHKIFTQPGLNNLDIYYLVQIYTKVVLK